MLILIVSVRKLLLELLCQGSFPTLLALLLSWVTLQDQCFGFTLVKCNRILELLKNQSLSWDRAVCILPMLGAYGLGLCLQPAKHRMITLSQLVSCPEGEQHLGAGFGGPSSRFRALLRPFI